MKKELIVFIFLLLISFIIHNTRSKYVYALDMDSSRFHIDSANVNSASGDKSSSGYKLQDSIGQVAAGQFSSSGYVVKAGFEYIHSIIPFKFSISDISINLGNLTPNTPSTASTVLTVSFGSAGQYQVTAIEETPLKTLSSQAIPNTSCDGGLNTCTISLAKIWSSSSVYGFGFNMAGDDIASDFLSSSYFRPFPDRSSAQSPAVIMTSTNVGKNRQATLTFKVNISPIQQPGSYQTIVNFVATPSF